MLGIVLAAGGGTRLRPLTDELPKTLLSVDDDGRSIFELAVRNLSEVGITHVVAVTGHAAEKIDEVTPTLEQRYGVTIEPVYNDRFATWNNAYSLWSARAAYAEGALLVNGDTVHPVEVEQRLLDGRGTAPITLALDDAKSLAEEEMKVQLRDGRLHRIHKGLDPSTVDGEYIGVTLIEPEAADDLTAALERTFEADPSLYYEDGYQSFADAGGEIRAVSVGGLSWIEVDDHDDLAGARDIACRY